MELSERQKSLLFWASFVSLAAAGVGFALRVMTMGQWGADFDQLGWRGRACAAGAAVSVQYATDNATNPGTFGNRCPQIGVGAYMCAFLGTVTVHAPPNSQRIRFHDFEAVGT